MATFTNQATLTYNGTTTASNIVTGEILEVLSAQKNAVVDAYTAGDDITYVISILNSGTLPINGLTLTDNLGAYASGTATLTPLNYLADSVKYYVNGVLQTTPTVTAGPPLSITGINVPAGGNAIIAYETQTNAFAPLQSESAITNIVTAEGGGITSITAEETVGVVAAPILAITKSVSPVPENGTLTYTFQIQNSGNTAADAAAGIVVTDTFTPRLSNLTATLNGTALVLNTDYTYDETTGEFATVAGRITVPAATFITNPATGTISTDPGVTTLTISGTI
mgnify:CR=1 FL=1